MQATHSYPPAKIHGTQRARQKAGNRCWEEGLGGRKAQVWVFPKEARLTDSKHTTRCGHPEGPEGLRNLELQGQPARFGSNPHTVNGGLRPLPSPAFTATYRLSLYTQLAFPGWETPTKLASTVPPSG